LFATSLVPAFGAHVGCAGIAVLLTNEGVAIDTDAVGARCGVNAHSGRRATITVRLFYVHAAAFRFIARCRRAFVLIAVPRTERRAAADTAASAVAMIVGGTKEAVVAVHLSGRIFLHTPTVAVLTFLIGAWISCVRTRHLISTAARTGLTGGCCGARQPILTRCTVGD